MLLAKEAQKSGLTLMVGCMLGTSLAMAPAMIIAQHCTFIDLDGPLLLATDRNNGIIYNNGEMSTPSDKLWG
jgi:L-alanine-DL-glutamate epimerase-like enolase superfamily enzyme